MTDDRKVLMILALAPIPIVGSSILSYLAMRLLGGLRRALGLIVIGTAISVAVASAFAYLFSHVLALYLIGLDVVAAMAGVGLAYKLSSPKVKVTDYYIEVEARTTSFGMSGLEPDELFVEAVHRVYGFFNQHYRNYLSEAVNCPVKTKVIVSEGGKEMKVVKKCRSFSVTVALNKGVVTVSLTVPY